ncbi:MAG: PEP-CTERM sorting domain-containing protein [Planctomycetaceae bacterium]|nr:PEP-CTERM sorting domain-containing protein [Planctomycetaceae bacterium]
MKRKIAVLLVLIVSLFGVYADALTCRWNTGISNGSWFTASNWSTLTVPTALDGVQMYGSSSQSSGAFIQAGENAFALEIRNGGGTESYNTPSYLTMNGGTLTTANWLMMGTDSSGNRSGVFVMNDGLVTLGTGTRTNGHLYVGSGYTNMLSTAMVKGELQMNGGVIDAGGTFGIGRRHTTGIVHLDGGTIYANNFTMKDPSEIVGTLSGSAYMDITGGKMIITGDRSEVISTYISNGWLTGYGSEDDIRFDFDVTNAGKTTVWAVPEPATMCLMAAGLLGVIRRKK